MKLERGCGMFVVGVFSISTRLYTTHRTSSPCGGRQTSRVFVRRYIHRTHRCVTLDRAAAVTMRFLRQVSTLGIVTVAGFVDWADAAGIGAEEAPRFSEKPVCVCDGYNFSFFQRAILLVD